MIGYLAVVSLILLVQVGAVGAETEVVVYSDDNYLPYAYKEGGQARGIYTEILKKAFARMDGFKVRIETVPWKRGVSYLEKGTGFALYPPYKRQEQRPFIRPYSTPLWDEKVVVMCREDIMAQPRPDWPADYYGLKIGLNAGYMMGGDGFFAAVKEGKINLYEGNKNSDILALMAKRRLDCYVNERLSILWALKRMRMSGDYDDIGIQRNLVEGPTISREQTYLGYTDRDEGQFSFKADFVKKFDAAIDSMKQSGELQDIVEGFVKP